MLKKMACIPLFVALVFSTSLFAEETPAVGGLWMTDFEAAKAKAKAEKKLLLLDFTGSDWCGWCITLHKEVFDLPTFKTEAPKKFVLVELDYPQEKKLPRALKVQNDKLAKVYNIEGYPTVYITDAEGKPVAKTGYVAGGPEKYMESLNGFIATHDAVVAVRAKLGASTGLDRAKLLDELLEAEEKLGLENKESAKFEAEIITLDADNKAGLKSKYTIKGMIVEAQNLLQAEKFDEAKVICEKALAQPGMTAVSKQDAYFIAGECHVGKKNFSEAVACFTKARDADPKSENAEQIGKLLTRYKALAEAQAAVEKIKVEVAAKQGPERAKGLDQLIEAQLTLPKKAREAATEIEKWSKEIVSLDTDNKLGLKTKYEFRELFTEAKRSARAKDAEKAKTTLEKALQLPGLTPEQKKEAEKLKNSLEPKEPKTKKSEKADAAK